MSAQKDRKMLIDKDSGAIHLPNDFVISPGLEQAGFRASACFKQASSYDANTLPFIHYRFDGGTLDGHPLNVNLCFYGELLVETSLSANFYPPASKGWENYSPEIEYRTKDFHDELLRQALGEPAWKIPWARWLSLSSKSATARGPLEYHYHWGSVWSVYDEKSGSSFIGVTYGSRLRDAQDDYLRRNNEA
jgi:hypothetical protein